jgi:HK97 family phage prohead protease
MKVERRSIHAGLHRRGDTPERIRMTIPYNSMSSDLGGFREQIAPGAFARSLSEGKDVMALWNHNPDMPLGRRSNGTLELEDDDGSNWLEALLEPDDTSWNEDARKSIRSGTVNGASFAFVTREDMWVRAGGEWRRTLLDVDLLDVSPTPSPAYGESKASTT